MPGNYFLVFRLKHGNNLEFGANAYADIKVSEKPIASKVAIQAEEDERVEEISLAAFAKEDKEPRVYVTN